MSNCLKDMWMWHSLSHGLVADLAALSKRLDFDGIEGLFQPKCFYDVTGLTVLDTTNI